MTNLPDPLVALNGEPIEDAYSWNGRRRNEILELFRTHVYGRMPDLSSASISFDPTNKVEILGGRAAYKRVSINVSGPHGQVSFDLHLITPTHTNLPVPMFLTIGLGSIQSPPSQMLVEQYPIEKIVDGGYGFAIFDVNEVAPDRNNAFDRGVHAALGRSNTGDSWGGLAAWGWGCSRAMDYFETNAEIAARRIALVGHSRGGKAALWCGAEDERFALVISNESGCSGAAITRGKAGEQIANITGAFPYWFCENYKSYADNTEALPVDQHELIALIAPRPVYVSSATEDTWADPESEFLGCVYAEPVYKLYGLPGLGASEMPPPETPLHGGAIGYHLRTGKHALTHYDWECFISFAGSHI